MNNILLATVTAINIFISPIAPNAIPVPDSKTEIKVDKNTKNWTVKPSETLSAIAVENYGSENYWTTIWNDNPWIENPYVIETGWTIKLRSKKPLKPDNLNAELNNKLLYAKSVTQNVVQPKIIGESNTNSGITNISGPLNEAQIQYLGNCESGMTATRNSGNGYYGAFQFSMRTWNRMGTFYARADVAPLEAQKDALQRLVSQSNIFGQFPGCSRKMRAAGLI